jgi:hypothetical protein
MANKQMQYFHELVAQERYREARGILETEDIAPDIAEKWMAWLDHLHTEERVQVGVLSDKARYDRQQSTIATAKVVGSAIAFVFTLIVIPLLFYVFMTDSVGVGRVFPVLAGILFGYLGWYRFLFHFTSNHRAELTGVIVFVLLAVSGIPFIGYLGESLTTWTAAVALQLPFWSYITSSIGEFMGERVVRLFMPSDDHAIKTTDSRK